MTRIEREYRELCAREGVVLQRIERHRKHYRLHFETGFIFAAGSPSDWRNSLNVRSSIRRLHR